MSKAVAKKEDAPVSAPVQEGAALIQMIERVALNPNADIDKLERLLNMQERVMGQRAKAAYTAALAEMQPDLPVIKERGGIKDRHGNVQSTYALWEDINEAIKPVLAKHGFALSFRTGRQDDRIIVTGILSHRDGHSEETTMQLPIDGSGSKNAVQSVGSSTSYGKRYTASALLNLTSRGEDDDGKKGGASSPISDEQVSQLLSLIVDTNSDIPRFCAYFKVEKIEDLPADKFDRAIAALNAKPGARK
jgi:hypothetical protein